MKIELKKITVREVAEGYVDSEEEGVVGYDGKLEHPPEVPARVRLRREKAERRHRHHPQGLPAERHVLGRHRAKAPYEVMDGQQRTISFCQYVDGDFSDPVDGHPMAFHNLPNTLQDQILDYTLMVYFCSGTDKEKLDWFRIINIAGVRAHRSGTPQRRLHRAVAHPRQADLLQDELCRLPARPQVRDWLPDPPGASWRPPSRGCPAGKIEQYMSVHQHDPNANELWSYFQAVISWVELTFTTYRK